MRNRVFAILVLAASGWAQQAPSVVGAADYSSGTSTGIPRGSIFTVAFPGPGAALAGEGVSAGIWTAPAGAGTLLAQAALLYVSPSQINAIMPPSIGAGSYFVGV